MPAAPEVMAVVKADGYGHGAVEVGCAALAAGAAELGVVTIAEAVALRAGGITAPVLCWLHPPGTDFAPALEADVQIAVSSVRQLGDVVAAARQTGRTATVTVKVDTGLSRNGVSPADFPDVIAALGCAQADGVIQVRGIMSHLVHGDEPDNPFNDLQGKRLTTMREQAAAQGVVFELAHLSNSPAAMTRPDLAFDMVRPGIAVYGLSPHPRAWRHGAGSRHDLEMPCRAGAFGARRRRVSYGHRWIADRDTTLALLPVGYADGIFRSLSGKIEVLINDRRRPAVGRICMDQFVVDLGPDVTDVTEGDEAILFGPGTQGEQTAQDWAELLGTINYEVVTSPRGRITRTYLQAGRGR